MNDFRTVYKKDFTAQPFFETINFRPTSRRNPIAESFKEYLLVDSSEPATGPSDELWTDFLENKYKVEKPKLAERYFKNGLNVDLLKKIRNNDGLTVYEKELCRRDKVVEEKKGLGFVIDAGAIPLTTSRSSYRDPRVIRKTAFYRVDKIVPPTTLGSDDKFSKAFPINAADTTYLAMIGKLGEEIIESEMYGKIN